MTECTGFFPPLRWLLDAGCPGLPDTAKTLFGKCFTKGPRIPGRLCWDFSFPGMYSLWSWYLLSLAGGIAKGSKLQPHMQPHISISLNAFILQCWLPVWNFAENHEFFNDSLCSRWCNCTSGNLMPFSESYDCKGSSTSCSDRFVYIYVLDGILVAALIWAVCYGCHLTCTIYLGSFSVSPLHLALLAFWNGWKLQILGDRSEEQAFDILKRDLFQREEQGFLVNLTFYQLLKLSESPRGVTRVATGRLYLLVSESNKYLVGLEELAAPLNSRS